MRGVAAGGRAASWFRLEVLDSGGLDAWPDGLGTIHARDLGGLLIRSVLPPGQALAAADRLESGSRFEAHRLGVHFTGWSLGLTLDHACSDWSDYLGGVPAWWAASEAAGLGAIWERIDATLAAIAGGRPVVVPAAPDGRPYLATTLRRLPPGGLLPPHLGNEQPTRPPFRHLNTLIDGETLISFFLTLRPAAAGGELVVYDLSDEELDASCMYRGRTRVEHMLEGRARRVITPGPGDLLVFDGGRYVHQVAPVRGDRHRWTAGGFMAFTPGGDRIYRWS